MIQQDNGTLIFMKLKPQSKAAFATSIFMGVKHYIALNRAARRFLRSNSIKQLGLNVDLETNSIS